MKAAKRIIYGNTGPHGSINNDKAARAVLQYRNTPIQGIGLSPAQLLLHRRLKDSIPAQPSLYKPHPEWMKAAEQRDEMLAYRNQKLSERYNISAHSLPHLSEGDRVAIQNQTNKLWSTTGKIVECLPNRQYKIRVDGSGRVTLRNRRFLRKLKCESTIPRLIPGAETSKENSTIHSSPKRPIEQSKFVTSSDHTHHTPTTITPDSLTTPIPTPLLSTPVSTTRISPNAAPSRVPRALLQLFPYNKPGLKDTPPSGRSLTRGEGRGDVEYS